MKNSKKTQPMSQNVQIEEALKALETKGKKIRQGEYCQACGARKQTKKISGKFLCSSCRP